MTDNDEGKLPARSRKPVDAEAQAARARERVAEAGVADRVEIRL